VSERLKGKLAFVTAAGQGIGFAIAGAFLAEGASVIATDLAADKLKNLKTDKTFALDVRSTEKVDALAATVIDKFGAPNILVNCAGYVHQGSVLDCSEGDWDFSFDLNVKSMHRTLRAFVPAMLKNGGGSIINISSTVSSIRGVPDRYAYGASKGAIIGLTKAVAADFIRQSMQRDLSRHHPVAVVRRTRRRHRQKDGSIFRSHPGSLYRPSAHRASGNRAGSGCAGGFPCLR
jgi:2-keto-3-deoxy-L-fuconate dehydrogenase